MLPQHEQAGKMILARSHDLAAAIVARHYVREPALAERYGPSGRAKCLKDAAYHLAYLAEALHAGSRVLFVDYVEWARVMLASRGIPVEDLALHLHCLREVLAENLDAETGDLVAAYVEEGLRHLNVEVADVTTWVLEDEPLQQLAGQYLAALLGGARHAAQRLILDAVEGGTSVRALYLNVFQRTQHEIGRRWQRNELTVAQEHYCTAVTQQIMAQLYPYIFTPVPKEKTLVMACVSNELHEIGARMVADFLEMEGWNTFYLGANTPVRAIVEAVVRYKAQVLAVSATMTYHIHAVRDLIEAVRQHEACRDVKVMVGGYPFNLDPTLWERVGADGCAHSADEAVELAHHLAGGQQ